MFRAINKSKENAVPLLIVLNMVLLISLAGVATLAFRSQGSKAAQGIVQIADADGTPPLPSGSGGSPPASANTVQPAGTTNDQAASPAPSTEAAHQDEPANNAAAGQDADSAAEQPVAPQDQDEPPPDTDNDQPAVPDEPPSASPSVGIAQPPATDDSGAPPSEQVVGAGKPIETTNFTFDGAPATPQPWQPTDWDVTVHSRDTATWTTLEAMQAQHGEDCSPPPNTHPISTYDQAVFQCKDHIMTAINASGYGVVYLTPNRMVDLSQGEAVVRFDMSTLRSSNRDWVDLWITPYADNLQLPLENWLPDLQGAPRNAIQIRMDNTPGGTYFRATVYRNFAAEDVPSASQVAYETVLTPDAKRRDTFELRLSQTQITFGMPNYNLWWVNQQIAPLGWDAGVVQLGQHSYNPAKAEECALGCMPNTWHWDNVQIGPARPFTIIRADQRRATASQAQVTFPRGAPTNANLRFAGIGNNLEVSFDNGTTWQAAQRQAQELNNEYQFSSYWTPIPPGVKAIQLRGQGVTDDGWLARDLSIWSLDP